MKFESPPVGGVKLVKTYTFKRGDYVIDVKHEIVNASDAPVSPALYLQLVRDGNAPPGESSFYFTFTGPAIYTDGSKFQKIEFKDIEKRARREADHTTAPTTAGSRWCSTTSLSAWLIDKHGSRASYRRRVLHGRRSTPTRLLGRHAGAAAARSRPARPRPSTPRCSSARRRKTSSPRSRRGLELVKDYGWLHDPRQAAVLAADAAAQAVRQLGLVDRRPGGAAEDRLLLAQRQGLRARWPR